MYDTPGKESASSALLKESFGDRLKIICITPEVSEEYISFIAENEVDSIIV
jgi:hypothetical protein